MREIKFRAWDGDLEEYIDYTGLDIPVESLNNSNTLIWEQFTGLYDATKWEDLTEDERTEWTRHGNFPSEWKGKEIYEGDVIAYEETRFIVKWDNSHAMYKCFFANIPEHYCNLDDKYISVNFKVVGNIHEVDK